MSLLQLPIALRNFKQPSSILTIQRTSTTATLQAKTQQTLEAQLISYIRHQHREASKPQQITSNMAFLTPGLRRGLYLSTPLILSTPMLISQYRQSFGRRIYCDSADPFTKITSDLTRGYASEAKTPIITESGAPNPKALRQVSMGSILGVFCGLGISVFSKPLAILIGLGIFLLQVSSSRKGLWL